MHHLLYQSLANAGVFGPRVTLIQADSNKIEMKPFVSLLHNYPQGLYGLQKQHANEQTTP